MRVFIIFLLVLLTSLPVWAQTYGNEWINYNQKYYQFSITKDGVYRISHQSLIDAGIPIGTITANQIQVFGKQREVPLYVKDNGDTVLMQEIISNSMLKKTP